MSLLMVFVDGLGIGEFDRRKNPLARFPSPFLSFFKDKALDAIPYGGQLVPTDVTMGIPGLPQSATGQTALLTGVNASRIFLSGT